MTDTGKLAVHPRQRPDERGVQDPTVHYQMEIEQGTSPHVTVPKTCHTQLDNLKTFIDHFHTATTSVWWLQLIERCVHVTQCQHSHLSIAYVTFCGQTVNCELIILSIITIIITTMLTTWRYNYNGNTVINLLITLWKIYQLQIIMTTPPQTLLTQNAVWSLWLRNEQIFSFLSCNYRYWLIYLLVDRTHPQKQQLAICYTLL